MGDKSIEDLVLFRILLLGVGVAILVWSIDILVDVFLFNKGSIIQQIFSPEPSKIYFRWTVWGIIVIFSIYAQSIINKHKQTEDTLRGARDSFQTLYDNMEEGVLTIDRDYRIVSANRSFLKTTGLSSDEVLKKHCYEVSHNMKEPCNSPQHLCPIRAVLETGGPSTAVHTHSDKDGNEIYVEFTTSPIRDKEGNLVQIIEVIRDITERKRAEKELQESREQYRTLFSSGDDVVLVHGLAEDGMPGKFVEVNDVACQRLGYTREELLKLSPADIEASEKYKDMLPANEHVLFETAHIAKDRRRIPVEINARLFELNGQDAVLSIARDITERKQAEEEMIGRELEAALLQKMNSMLNMGMSKETIFNEIARGLTSTFGYDLSAIFTPNKDPKYLKVQSYSIDPDLLKNTENALSAGVLFMSYFTTLTGEKATDYSIPLYEGSFYQRLTRSREPIFTDDVEELVRAHTDRESLQALAPAIAKLSGMKYGMGAPLLAGDRSVGIIGVANKKELTQKDAERLARLGEQIGMCVERATIYGEVEGTYRELQKHASQLKETSQLKELFSDILSHDFLNPAGVVRNFAEMLVEKEVDPEKKEILEAIENTSSRLIDMIEDASLYSKLESTEKIESSIQDLNKILKDTIHDFEHLLEEKKMKIDYLSNGEYPVYAHSTLLIDVFSNLISNAIKYSPEGSKIEINIRDKGDRRVVYVKDWGEAIRDEDKEKLFTRFERLKKEGVKGTGLGLAIAKRIVDLHDGEIWLENNPAGGNIFYVSLPKEAA